MGRWPHPHHPPPTTSLIWPPHSHRRRWLGKNLRRLSRKAAHRLGHCSLELGIPPILGGERSLLDFDVRRNALVLDVPLAFEIVEPAAWRRDEPAVHQRRRIPDTDQAAPGLHTDQGTKFHLAEHVGEHVPA